MKLSLCLRVFIAAPMCLLLSCAGAPTTETELPTKGPRSSVEKVEGNIRATGLEPVFPSGYQCVPISSPYGSTTRFDGSSRRGDRNGSKHGGIDLSLKNGTPLLAIARGVVVTKGQGGRLEGNFLWLKFAPTDTGLPFFIYAKYQHLKEIPSLKEGEVVQLGQVVAMSGNTGTTGGHYGPSGYYHLHLTTLAGPSGEYEILGMYNSKVKGTDSHFVDPLIAYKADLKDPEEVYKFEAAQKKIPVAVIGKDGKVVPTGSKVVWPVPCEFRD